MVKAKNYQQLVEVYIQKDAGWKLKGFGANSKPIRGKLTCMAAIWLD